MSKDRDFRQQRRRREFDDDSYQPPRDHGFAPRPSGPPRFAPPTGPQISATVKWFNPEKGFGFVQLSDGSGDAFLHVAVLSRSGYQTVSPGATLEVRAGPGQKGVQVTEVLSVDESTAVQEAPRRPPRPDRPAYGPPGGGGGGDQASVEEFGTVKFYDASRGFGFIARDLGGKDVFVHASALNRAGIAGLAEGQRVSMDIIEGRKGPEASGVRLA